MRLDVKTIALALIVGISTPAIAQQNDHVITLERTICFGACPAYLLQIDSTGAVSFRQGPPGNRHEERKSAITADELRDLVAGFAAVHFFERDDVYPETATDGPTTYIELTLGGKSKKIKHFDYAPAGLEELERTIERTTNIHRWLHGDPKRFSLHSPVAGPYSSVGEDLKNETYVRHDAYDRIKPGMTPLMQAASGMGIAAEIQAARNRMQRVTTADQERWTANAIRMDAGARVDQRDHHGDTALIGAAAVRFLGNDLSGRISAQVLGILLAHGASVDATNDLGESALMWAAWAGNPESIKVLLNAGANPARLDESGHDALFYLRGSRDTWSFDPARVERYNQAESVLQSVLKQK